MWLQAILSRSAGLETHQDKRLFNFDELLNAAREARQIADGDLEPANTSVVFDMKALRQSLDLSQDQFAEYLGLSVATLGNWETGKLGNWEKGRREPTGPGKKLLELLTRRPELIDELMPVSK